MTKQEEIREGLISTLGQVQADMALAYLNSQGVVIKVDWKTNDTDWAAFIETEAATEIVAVEPLIGT